jgi:hypothetical protein
MLKELIDKIKGMSHENELDPDEPKQYKIDRYLESLRIEHQRQQEEQEKIRLKIAIAEYKKRMLREHMFGIKDKFERKQSYLKAKKKKVCTILKNHSSFLR